MSPTSFVLENPAIPSGSKISVTAVNSYIASHIADKLLAASYSVCSTVRDVDKSAWMKPFFVAWYPHETTAFELVRVSDLLTLSCINELVRAVAGVIYTSTSISVTAKDAGIAIERNTRTALSAVKAARKQKSVKRFVFTSSLWAAACPKFPVMPPPLRRRAGMVEPREGHMHRTPMSLASSAQQRRLQRR
jgi:nucleoside-diphosphate-sugar epimerase